MVPPGRMEKAIKVEARHTDIAALEEKRFASLETGGGSDATKTGPKTFIMLPSFSFYCKPQARTREDRAKSWEPLYLNPERVLP